MSNFNFYYQDQWKDFTPTPSGEHPNFPATNTKLDDYRSDVWRSLYGEGSNWGNFIIVTANSYIDFDEGGGELNAQVTPATYTVVSLLAEIKSVMETAGAHTYAPEYVETGADKGKFKIVDSTGTVALLTNTGTNVANGIWDTIGFTTTGSDYAAAASHTADEVRLHTAELLTQDFASALGFYGCVVVGHNKTASGTVYVEFSADNFATAAAVSTALSVSSENSNILYHFYSSAQTYRYARLRIVDPENGDYYVEIGRANLFLASFEPTANFNPFNYGESETDPSLIVSSPDGNESGFEYENYSQWRYNFYVLSADRATFKTVISDRGRLGSLVIVEDTATPVPRFVAIDWHNWTPVSFDENVFTLSINFRELR